MSSKNAKTPKRRIEGDVARLATQLKSTDLVVFDVETTGLDPHRDRIVGAGFYFPHSDRCFYINLLHSFEDSRYPRTTVDQFKRALSPFLRRRKNRVIAHNATFEIRFLWRLGLRPKCRFIDTMTRVHRVDECSRQYAHKKGSSYHPLVEKEVGYGLKKLTASLFHERPPTIVEATGNRSVLYAPTHDVARYCLFDCLNTHRLYQWAERQRDYPVILDTIDDRSNVSNAAILWNGILVDRGEIERQIVGYCNAITACRHEIWKRVSGRPQIDTPNERRQLLRGLSLDTELDYDPFFEVVEGDREPSIERDKLIKLITEISDKRKREILALLLAKSQQEHRISTFLQPFRNTGHGGRFYPNLFWSLIASTRYSSSPNIQNLPGKADADEPWQEIVPAGSLSKQVTRNIVIATSGHKFVSVDLKSAEPRYLAVYCQQALNKTPDISDDIRLINQEREIRYPALAKLKRRLQQTPPLRRKPIEWPSYQEDPLWRVFKYGDFGGDPYVALLAACLPEEFAANKNDKKWVKKNRVVGKRGFLALTYGASAESLAPQLGWSVARTKAAICSLDGRFATILPTKELARRQVNRLGYVRTLYARKRRINGYYQLASGLEPLEIAFTGTKKPNGRYDHYRLRIIVVSTYRQGVIAFVEKAIRLFRESDQGEVVFSADPTTGNITHHDKSDLLFRADHFIDPPFRSLAYGRTEWVRDIYGFVRYLPRQESAIRSAFNGIFQGTGADHLREIQNTISSRIRYAKLVLTMHDSLLFEVEASRVDRFLNEICNYVQPPSWADIPFPLEAEVGDRFGSLEEV